MKRGNVLLAGIVMLLSIACESRYRVFVEFTTAPGLKENLDVRLGEQSIGRTGAIEVHKGLVTCEVFLNSADAIPAETVFLIAERSPGQTLLVAYPRGAPMVIERSASPPKFRGAANRVELAKIIGEDELGKVMKFVDDVIDVVIRRLSR